MAMGGVAQAAGVKGAGHGLMYGGLGRVIRVGQSLTGRDDVVQTTRPHMQHEEAS